MMVFKNTKGVAQRLLLLLLLACCCCYCCCCYCWPAAAGAVAAAAETARETAAGPERRSAAGAAEEAAGAKAARAKAARAEATARWRQRWRRRLQGGGGGGGGSVAAAAAVGRAALLQRCCCCSGAHQPLLLTYERAGTRQHVHRGGSMCTGVGREGWDGFESRPHTFWGSSRHFPASGVVGKRRGPALHRPTTLGGLCSCILAASCACEGRPEMTRPPPWRAARSLRQPRTCEVESVYG